MASTACPEPTINPNATNGGSNATAIITPITTEDMPEAVETAPTTPAHNAITTSIKPIDNLDEI